MAYVHSLGVLHGDLKTANVLLSSNTDDPDLFTAKVGGCLGQVWGQVHVGGMGMWGAHGKGTHSFIPEVAGVGAG